MKTLAERLAWARKRKGLTQGALAAEIGKKQGYIGNLEAGTRLSSRAVTQLAGVLDVDAEWLAEGKGSPFPDTGKQQNNDQVELVYVTLREMRLLTAFRETEEEARQQIETMAEAAPRRKLLRTHNQA